jgi:hypothetical protein
MYIQSKKNSIHHTCIQPNCSSFYNDEFKKLCFSKKEFIKYEKKKIEDYLSKSSLIKCGGVGCNKYLLPDYSMKIKCSCGFESFNYQVYSKELSVIWIYNNCKKCPKCFVNIHKYSGCDKIVCSNCKSSFCWNCLSFSTICKCL